MKAISKCTNIPNAKKITELPKHNLCLLQINTTLINMPHVDSLSPSSVALNVKKSTDNNSEKRRKSSTKN